MKKILAIYLCFLAVCLHAVNSELACESLRNYALNITDINNGTIGSYADSYTFISNAMLTIKAQALTVEQYISSSMSDGNGQVATQDAANALNTIKSNSDLALLNASAGLSEMQAAHSYFQNFDCGTCSEGGTTGGGGTNDCCVSLGESLSLLDSHMTSNLEQIKTNQQLLRTSLNTLSDALLSDLGMITNQLELLHSDLTSPGGESVADLCYFMLTNIQPLGVAIDSMNLKLSDIQSALKMSGSSNYVLPEIYNALDRQLALLSNISTNLYSMNNVFASSNGSGYRFFRDYKDAYLFAQSDGQYSNLNLFLGLFDHTAYDYSLDYSNYLKTYLSSLDSGLVNLGFGGDWSFMLESLNYSNYMLYKTLWGDNAPINYNTTNLVQAIYDALIDRYTGSNYLQNVIVNQGLFQDIMTEGFSGLGDVTNLMAEIIQKQADCINANSNFFNVAIGLYTNFNDSAVVDSAALSNYIVGEQINYQYYSRRPWFERIEFLLQYANGNVSQSSSELESTGDTTEAQVASFTNSLDSTKSSFYDITNVFGNVYSSASTLLEDFQSAFEDNLPHGSPNMVFTFYSSDSQDSSSFLDSISIDTQNFVFRDAWSSAVNISRDLFVILWGLLNVISSLWLLFRVAQFTVKTIIINGLMRFSHSMIASKGH